MTGRASLAMARLLAAGIVILLAVQPADAQRADRRAPLPRPLQALGKAFDELRHLGDRRPGRATRERTGGDQLQRPRRERPPEIARLPRPRPATASPGQGLQPEERTAEAELPPPAAAEPPENVTQAVAGPPAVDAVQIPAEPGTASAESEPSGAAEPAAMVEGLVRLPRPRPAAASAEPAPRLRASLAEAELSESMPAPPTDLLEGPPEGGVPTEPSAVAAAAIDGLTRLPRPRPASAPSAVLALLEPGTVQEPEAPMAPPVPVALSGDEASCFARLKDLGVAFKRMDSVGMGNCHIKAPLEVASLGSGVSVASAAIMNCRTTEALALWVKDVMVPAARTHLDAVPTTIVPGSTYDCRGRNNQSLGRLSEHAKANAFDVMSIAFADREPLAVEARQFDSPEGEFQAAIRRDSCAYFTTVLGPGSDAAHATHFHFDMAVRRGGYRLCD